LSQQQKKSLMSKNWITVFGRAGCGVTERFVSDLGQAGHPFAYVSIPPGVDRDVWWSYVQSRAPEVGQWPGTFPTVIVWEPTPKVFDSSALNYIAGKEFSKLDSHHTPNFQAATQKSINYFQI
jgi:hypothetical protein